MPVAAITKQGLGTMAILVAALWGCLLGERLIVSRANLEMGQALREIGRMQAKVRQPLVRPLQTPQVRA
jgi:hypothetical protein